MEKKPSLNGFTTDLLALAMLDAFSYVRIMLKVMLA